MTTGAGGVFTCRRARSAAILALLIMLVVVETTALHLLLVRWLPWLAYTLTTLSVAAIIWLAADYRLMGREAARLDATLIRLRIGRRLAAAIPREALAEAIAPRWRDLGAAAPRYLNPTKPATPNVLLVFREPQTVTLAGGLRRPVARLALHLDDPQAFLEALGPTR